MRKLRLSRVLFFMYLITIPGFIYGFINYFILGNSLTIWRLSLREALSTMFTNGVIVIYSELAVVLHLPIKYLWEQAHIHEKSNDNEAEVRIESNDYGDYRCKSCGHNWRRYGNGGLVYGTVERCPKCGSSHVELTMSNGTVWR